MDKAEIILQEFERRHPDYVAIQIRLLAIERRKISKKEFVLFNNILKC